MNKVFMFLAFVFLSRVLFAQDFKSINLELGSLAKPEKIIKVDENSFIVMSVMDDDKSKKVFLTIIDTREGREAKERDEKFVFEGATQISLYKSAEDVYLIYCSVLSAKIEVKAKQFDIGLGLISEKTIYTFKSDNAAQLGSVSVLRNEYNGATYIYHEKAYQKDKKEEATIVWLDKDLNEIAIQNYTLPHNDKPRKTNVPVAGMDRLFVLKRVFEVGKNDYYFLSFTKSSSTPTNKNMGYGTARITDVQHALNDKDEMQIMASTAPAAGGGVNSFIAARYAADGTQLENKFLSNEVLENQLFKGIMKKTPFMHVRGAGDWVDHEGKGNFIWIAAGIENKKGEDNFHFKEYYVVKPFQNPAQATVVNLSISSSEPEVRNFSLANAKDETSFVNVSSLVAPVGKSKASVVQSQIKIDYFENERFYQSGAFALDLMENSKFYTACPILFQSNTVYLISANDRNFYFNSVRIKD
ncbi:MAG: hypothetical protein ACK4K0_03030 [Flavobacteriales bacterium]